MPTTDELCHSIRAYHRERLFWMDQRKRLANALGAFLRRAEGWNRDLPAKEQNAILTRVSAAVKAGERCIKTGELPDDNDLFNKFDDLIIESLRGRAPFERMEHQALLAMNRLVRKLPVWTAWGVDIKGLGEASLGTIVGEAGNLSNFATHSKLWKRMGLAVIDGVRQGGLKSNASAEKWIAHGYSGQRRSFVFVIGEVMIRGGTYRAIYDSAKEFERAKAVAAGKIVEPASARTKADPEHFISDGHIHKRAQRKMEKRLLRDLWRAWNAAEARDELSANAAEDAVPDAAADEATASKHMPSKAVTLMPDFVRTPSPQTGV